MKQIKQKKKYDKLTKEKLMKTNLDKNKVVEEAKNKRDQERLKKRIKKQNQDLPEFNDDDYEPVEMRTSATGGKPKMNPIAELKQKISGFINDPDKLMKYKTKNYKGSNNTADIDAFIHRARVEQKKHQRDLAQIESEAFDQELKTQINQARRFLKRERKKGSLKSKSLINATISN